MEVDGDQGTIKSGRIISAYQLKLGAWIEDSWLTLWRNAN